MRRHYVPKAAAVACWALAQFTSAQQAGPLADAGAVRYWEAKAQCWSMLAKTEASQGDTHGTPTAAAGNARRIRESLEAGQLPNAETEQPIFKQKFLPSGDSRYGRPKWRVDIMRIDATQNRYAERSCRTATSACLEVAQQSVYENMEETRGARWNHGRPEIDMALELAKQADAEFASACPDRRSLTAVEVPRQALEEIQLPAETLFQFDRGDTGGLVAGGQEAIKSLASKVQSYGVRVTQIEVVGHTDRLGNARRNAALSAQRAQTVATLMTRQGVEQPITAKGAGSASPTTNGACKGSDPTPALIACLQPDRRVVIRLLPPIEQQ